jgi:hypothetical protein
MNNFVILFLILFIFYIFRIMFDSIRLVYLLLFFRFRFISFFLFITVFIGGFWLFVLVFIIRIIYFLFLVRISLGGVQCSLADDFFQFKYYIIHFIIIMV